MTNFDDINPDAGETFAWCFSHGRMHRFTAEPWCTAEWVRLPGTTEADARTVKIEWYGEAQFMHHLPFEKQAEVAGVDG